MKNIFTLVFAFLFAVSLFAQAPEKMSYQAVVRDGSNELVINQTVGMQISILQGTVSGISVYTETQTPTTNSNGLVSLEIGSGTSVSGTFSAIDWSAGPYFIKTETDPNGGINYTITGTSQLMSVPYALYAKTSGNGEGPQGPAGPAGADGNDGATGATGPQGPAGNNGTDGTSTTVEVSTASESDCPAGGRVITFLTVDANGNTTSDTSTICNGVNGTNGQDATSNDRVAGIIYFDPQSSGNCSILSQTSNVSSGGISWCQFVPANTYTGAEAFFRLNVGLYQPEKSIFSLSSTCDVYALGEENCSTGSHVFQRMDIESGSFLTIGLHPTMSALLTQLAQGEVSDGGIIESISVRRYGFRVNLEVETF